MRNEKTVVGWEQINKDCCLDIGEKPGIVYAEVLNSGCLGGNENQRMKYWTGIVGNK